MSPAPVDLVNAIELAGRAASIEREPGLGELPRLVEAGALEGTRTRAQLDFGLFEGRPTVTANVTAIVVLTCQRCLRPCECSVSESTPLVIMSRDDGSVPAGYEVWVGDPERLPVADVIEEQILLGLPLVALHEREADCAAAAGPDPAASRSEDRQRPFANLRELLDKGGH
jgi:uncharacterized protein